MNTDLTFITNQKGQSLKERFEVLIKDTRLFDCLVGYFYASGFHAVYKSLQSAEKVRILIGISTDPQTYDMMQKAKSAQAALQFSSAETKEKLGGMVERASRLRSARQNLIETSSRHGSPRRGYQHNSNKGCMT